MTRALVFLVAAVVGLVAWSVPASADQACKPVVGHFEAVLVPPGQGHCPVAPPPPEQPALCTAGRVWGGIQGNYQFVSTGILPSTAIAGPPEIFFFTGRSTIALKSGDQLLGADTGSIDLVSPFGGFASLITFDGGTGAMSNATGQIRLRGEFSASEGTTAGDYLGTLCSQ